MRARIVCVGNRLVPEDALGPRVFERLLATELPAGVEAIDGGLAGLSLLSIVEGAEHVVFVDAIVGDGARGEVIVIEDRDLVLDAEAEGARYDHGAGLDYLLRVLPHVVDGAPPRYAIVGVRGVADDALVDRVAARATELARGAE